MGKGQSKETKEKTRKLCAIVVYNKDNTVKQSDGEFFVNKLNNSKNELQIKLNKKCSNLFVVIEFKDFVLNTRDPRQIDCIARYYCRNTRYTKNQYKLIDDCIEYIFEEALGDLIAERGLKAHFFSKFT